MPEFVLLWNLPGETMCPGILLRGDFELVGEVDPFVRLSGLFLSLIKYVSVGSMIWAFLNMLGLPVLSLWADLLKDLRF